MSADQENPYQSPTSTLSMQESGGSQPLGCLATTFLAVVIGIGSSVIVGEALAFLALLPPINKWFGLTGEFDGLILIAMPMWTAGFGLITMTVFGVTFSRKFSMPLGIAVGLLLAGVFYWNIARTVNRPSEWYSMVTASVILAIALTSGVLIARRGLTRINDNRANPTKDTRDQRKHESRMRFLIIALTLVWSLIDFTVLRMIFQDELSLWLTPISLFGLIYGLALISFCAFQSAARSEIRIVARISLALLAASFATTLYLWVRIVWFQDF